MKFTKMQALGNDFVVLDGCQQSIKLTGTQIKWLGDRHFGIGFDQLLIIESTTIKAADFNYRIFNQDGQEVDQCGNGARAIARFVQLKKLSTKKSLCFATKQGFIHTQLMPHDQVKVSLGVPIFTPTAIPFDHPHQQTTYSLKLAKETVQASVLSLGNPHAVITVPEVSKAPIKTIGPTIQKLTQFPQGVNVGFMQIVSREAIKLRVLERGAGETLACGSGACAAVIAGIMQQKLDHIVDVALPGGHCSVSWESAGKPVWLTGPAEPVFEGSINLA